VRFSNRTQFTNNPFSDPHPDYHMKYADLRSQLPSKQRSVGDLVRFVANRTDDNPNYSLFIGAGCSVTSGVRSASQLITQWRQEICRSLPGGPSIADKSADHQRQFLKEHHSDWFNPSKEYSSLFEKRFDLQRQRRMFIESEVAGRFPSIGYAYLMAMVAQGYFRTLFTTNFDDLLNEAFYLYSNERPIVCAHDSSINSVTVSSKRPKIVKLHGDYLFDDLKATLRETESLEQNMKAKFTEFAKDSGLVVIGYSGSDRSIMDLLTSLLKSDDYFPAGVYWCLRTDSDVTEELRRILWRDRAYFVEIEGFDEVCSSLYSALNSGDVLPRSTFTTARRPGELVNKLLGDMRIPRSTPILLEAREKLSRLSKRSALASQIVQSDFDDRPALRGPDQGLTDDELLALSESQNLVDDGKYTEAIRHIQELLQAPSGPTLKRRLLRIQIGAYRLLCDNRSALAVVDQLIALYPKAASNYLLRASIETADGKKLDALEEANRLDPFSSAAKYQKARFLSGQARSAFGESRRALLEQALQLHEASVLVNPARTNESWPEIYRLTGEIEANKVKRLSLQRAVVDRVAQQNPLSPLCLRLECLHCEETKDGLAAQGVIERVRQIVERSGPEESLWALPFELRMRVVLGDLAGVSARLADVASNALLSRNTGVAARVAQVLRKSLGDDQLAERILRESLKDWDFDGDVFRDLVHLFIESNRAEEAADLLQRWGHRLVDESRFELELELLELKRDYGAALERLKVWCSQTGRKELDKRCYMLLCLGQNEEAEAIAREELEPVNFTPEAHVATVNYELARKRRGKKVDAGRLEAVQKFTSDDATHAAVYALLDRKQDMLRAIRQAVGTDRRFAYAVRRWPVFRSYVEDHDVLVAIGAKA
jgi:hypothetical protein